MKKFTVAEFNGIFPTEESCLEAIRDLIYPDGITCRKCQQITPHAKLSNRKAYSCANCGTHCYVLAGTIFEKSSTPLKSWYYAIYLMASTRTGISAKQLERELGVTYKTAWRMFDQVRKLFAEDITLEGLLVEVDETYVGGKDRFRHAYKRSGVRGRGAGGKTIVAGAVERKGRVVAKVVPDVTAETLLPNISRHVLPASTIYSDELPSYNRLGFMGYQHKRVHHAIGVYVDGDAHTNSIEGFWSLVKRGLSGVNHSVSAKKLQTYFDSYAFRYNHRDDATPMYETMFERIRQVRSGNYGEYAPLGT